MPLNKRHSFLVTMLVLLGVISATAEIKVGDPLPTLADFKLEGKLPESLKDKVVLLDFWASWCGPCGESFPVMDELQKKYGERGFVVIAINVDEKKADMDDFLKDHKVSFLILHDAKQKLVEKAGVPTMPSSFMIGKDGKVAFAHGGFHGGETKKQYEHEIESLLKGDTK